MLIYESKRFLINLIVDISLSIIRRIERYKNRNLAEKLRKLANGYDPE